jgi:NAD+ diphosphatase
MITFSGSPLDRLAARRDDAEWLAAQKARVYALRDGKPLVRDGRLAEVARREPALFLGMSDDTAVFAVELDAEPEAGGFEEMRPLALILPPEEAAIIGAARSLFEWHRRHPFCAACGNATRIASAGWKRVCAHCRSEHFPRVDPVVIMLAVHGERCLVGRQAAWPAGRMSALAGFVEPGESIEEACARELREEAGLVATRVRYMASQPWPFPSSLMIGLFADVANDDAVADGVELEAVRWLTRQEARGVVDGTHPEILAPSRFAIAHSLLRAWAAE